MDDCIIELEKSSMCKRFLSRRTPVFYSNVRQHQLLEHVVSLARSAMIDAAFDLSGALGIHLTRGVFGGYAVPESA